MRILGLMVVFLSQLAAASTTFSEEEITAAAKVLMAPVPECQAILGWSKPQDRLHLLAVELLVGKALNRDMERPDVLVPEFNTVEEIILGKLLKNRIGERRFPDGTVLNSGVLGHYINGERVPVDLSLIERTVNDFDQLVKLEFRLTTRVDELRSARNKPSPGYLYDNPMDYGVGGRFGAYDIYPPQATREAPLGKGSYQMVPFDPPTGADNGLRSPRSQLEQVSPTSGTVKPKTPEVYFDRRGHRRRIPPIGKNE